MRSKVLASLLVAIAFLLPAPALLAQDSSAPSEYAVKAAFLYNFALYTEWPTLPAEAFEFCVLGKDPFGFHLDNIGRKKLQGKVIHIRRLGANQDVKTCHLLFIPASEKDNYFRMAVMLSQQAILTVTDAPQVDEKWPVMMISLVPEGERYTFDINQAAAKIAGLTFSSKLLHLARNVK